MKSPILNSAKLFAHGSKQAETVGKPWVITHEIAKFQLRLNICRRAQTLEKGQQARVIAHETIGFEFGKDILTRGV